VEHLAQRPDAIVRPWRTATVVVSAIAAIELVLLVGAGIALLGRHLASTHVQATAKAHHVTPPVRRIAAPAVKPEPIGKPTLSRAGTSVIVLNGNGRTGAATTEASVVRSRGYRVAKVGNAGRGDYATSVVMYRPGFRAEAARLAHDLGFARFAPLDGLKPAALAGSQLLVVVGSKVA
jgi:LytR cell envelope-related transcriptional attenuator